MTADTWLAKIPDAFVRLAGVWGFAILLGIATFALVAWKRRMAWAVMPLSAALAVWWIWGNVRNVYSVMAVQYELGPVYLVDLCAAAVLPLLGAVAGMLFYRRRIEQTSPAARGSGMSRGEKAVAWIVAVMVALSIASAWWSTRKPADAASQRNARTRPPAPVALMDAEDLPALDSSPSAEPLMMILACDAVRVRCVFTTLCGIGFVMPGETPRHGTVVINKTVFNKTKLSSTTHEAYANLIDGTVDLILVVRGPSDNETAAARAKGVEFDSVPIALDALALTVNDNNPLGGLTLDQVRAVCSGAAADWKDLGGPAGAVAIYRRKLGPEDDVMTDKIPLGGRAMRGAGELVDETSNTPDNRVDCDARGIGFTSWYDDHFIAPPRHGDAFARRKGTRRQLDIDGFPPDASTIAWGTYPLVTPVYAVVRKGLPAGSKALILRDWMLTDRGQRMVRVSGYVPISARPAK